MKDSDHRKQIVAGIAVIVIIAVIVVATMSASQKPTASTTSTISPEATASATEATTIPTTAATSAATAQAYKDGSYTSTGSYSSPGGTEAITVTVTLKNGVISETSAQPKATDSDGAEYQAKFIGGYKSLVVGKNIDTVSLSRVSGSSLTSKGFNNALNAIKTQAKA